MTATEHVDGTADEIGTELVPAADTAPTNLFRTDDPVEVVERASRVADALKGVLQKQGLTQNIQGKDYVKVEGWTTLGSMLGIVPVCVWTRKLDDGWEARVEARTLDGRIIGAAEAECTRAERMWKQRDDYALRSMAQTRATSKALRGPLGFIVTLAGYEATPSDEMPAPAAAPAASEPIAVITKKRAAELVDTAFTIGVEDKLQLAASHAYSADVGDCSTKAKATLALAQLTLVQADKVEKWLQKKADELAVQQ